MNGKLSLWAGAAALALSLAATPASAQTQTWNLTPDIAGPWLEFGGKNFARLVEQFTEGRIKINVAAPGMIAPAFKVTEAVQNGLAEIGMNWAAYDQGIDVAGVPFAGWAGGLSPEEFMIWLFNEGGADMLHEWRMEKFGVASFPCQSIETEIFLHSHKPVRTLEDLKGLKIRTAGAWADIAAKLGATTVVIAGGETPDALQRRVVDAIEWAGPGINLAAGFHKLARYVVVPGIHAPASLQECMVRKDRWEALSKADQEALKLAGKLNMFETFLAYAEMDLKAWEELQKDPNVEFVQLDQSFIDAARKASFEWAEEQAAKNEWFKKVYESQRAFQKKIASWQEFRLPIGATKE